jgi:hypothetical protein
MNSSRTVFNRVSGYVLQQKFRGGNDQAMTQNGLMAVKQFRFSDP